MSRGAGSGSAGKKFFILSATLFLLAAGCGKQPASQQVSKPADQPVSGSDQQQQTQAKLPTGTSPIIPSPAVKVQTSDNSGKPDYKPGFIIVIQTVEGSNLNEKYSQILKGASAYDLLTIEHKVTSINYGSGMGEMVLSIDGIKPDNKHFWEFLVNGKFSNLGASNYVLKDGDEVEWKLEAISSSGE